MPPFPPCVSGLFAQLRVAEFEEKKGEMKEENPGGLKKEGARRRRCKSLINIESSRFSERDECCRCESVCVCVCVCVCSRLLPPLLSAINSLFSVFNYSP